MLQRDLKRIANESVFNPRKPEVKMKITMDAGNPDYWVTKAIEYLMDSKNTTLGSEQWHTQLRDAITLILLARAKANK